MLKKKGCQPQLLGVYLFRSCIASSTAESSFLRSSLYLLSFSSFSSLVRTFLGPWWWSWQSPPQQQSPVIFFVHLRTYTQLLSEVKYLNYQVYSKIVTIPKESEPHAQKWQTNLSLPTKRRHRHNQQKMGTSNHQHTRQLRTIKIQPNHGNTAGHQPKNSV